MTLKPDQKVLDFIRNIKPSPEWQRGLLEASAKAFNEEARTPVSGTYEERQIRELKAKVYEMENEMEKRKIRFTGKFLGKNIAIQTENKNTAMEIIGRLGLYFDIDNVKSKYNTLDYTEQEYVAMIKKYN